MERLRPGRRARRPATRDSLEAAAARGRERPQDGRHASSPLPPRSPPAPPRRHFYPLRVDFDQSVSGGCPRRNEVRGWGSGGGELEAGTHLALALDLLLVRLLPAPLARAPRAAPPPPPAPPTVAPKLARFPRRGGRGRRRVRVRTARRRPQCTVPHIGAGSRCHPADWRWWWRW